MTFVCVPILVNDVETALQSAKHAVKSGARLIEWRVDRIGSEPETVERLVRESPLPSIVTCRPEWEGGEFTGSEAERIALFEHVGLHARPRYIDLEFEALEREPSWRRRLSLAMTHPDQHREMDMRLILSLHDFEGRPAHLYQRIERMAEEPACSIIKVAWQARSLRDNLEVFELLCARPKPMIALCMGEFGLMSRVLASKFGGFLTFATLPTGDATAAGQPDIEVLKGVFGFPRIDESTRVYGLIGWPVGHSLGPRVHNAGFESIDYPGVYLPLPVAPGYEAFKATVGALLDWSPLDFFGASVTAPHKQNVMRFVDEEGGRIHESAEEAGAANTLIRTSSDGLEARNTDIAAMRDSVCAALTISRADLAEMRIAIVGTGGAARAALAAFSIHDAEVVIHGRSREAAKILATAFKNRPSISGFERRIEAAGIDDLTGARFDVLINATPIGMRGGPDSKGSAVLLDEGCRPDWGPATLVFDTIYTPTETPLLRAASNDGCRTLNGLDMFVRQAIEQFRSWTGRDPGEDVFRRIARAMSE